MTVAKAVALVQSGKRFLVSCHRRPDADALGSALAFAYVLKQLGKEVHLFVPETLPRSLNFLPGVDEIVRQVPAGSFDASWVMDIASSALLPPGFPDQRVRGTLVVVDHHVAHDDLGDLVVRDSDACATGEVVYNLAQALGVTSFDVHAATALYAAIVADTGGFRYASTGCRQLRIAADLVEVGVDAAAVARHLFEDWDMARLRLLGAILETLETEFDGRFAMLRVTRDMLQRVGADDDMVEGMVSYARMLRGVEIAVLLWEWPFDAEGNPGPMRTKVSLRSTGSLDVSRIAVALGGGGHRAAAGAEVESGLDEVLSQVRQQVRSLIPPLDS